jgi:predicted AAA+ superfamily ATPase
MSPEPKLGAWISGEGKREIKNPKYHLADSGIACALRRFTEDTFTIDNNPQALGGLLESFVLNEIQCAVPMQDADYRLYHWRSADQREIDILVDGGSHLVCVEVKASASVSGDDFKHLKRRTRSQQDVYRDRILFGSGKTHLW